MDELCSNSAYDSMVLLARIHLLIDLIGEGIFEKDL